MPSTSLVKQQGVSLLEVIIAAAIGGLLMAAMSGVVGGALEAERSTRLQNEALQQTRFALLRMVTAIGKTRHLMIPLAENPVTAWKESERNVLAVTLDPALDRNKDGWADANNDKDFLDVNRNLLRGVGEPERIDEDTSADNTSDAKSGIIGIDDDGDGFTDESGTPDDDEDTTNDEDRQDGLDNDSDGSMDEDPSGDLANDGMPGIIGIDDDVDGFTDEGSSSMKVDDDEDGLKDEDWLDPVVYYLNGTTLMERLPTINASSGSDYSAYPIVENVSQLLVKRSLGGNGSTVLAEITLTLSPPGIEPVSLKTTVVVGSGL